VASAAFIWAIIARMYAARSVGLKREMFSYVEGYAEVLPRLRERLEAEECNSVAGRRSGRSGPTGGAADPRTQRPYDWPTVKPSSSTT
jgi:hypothetical protein